MNLNSLSRRSRICAMSRRRHQWLLTTVAVGCLAGGGALAQPGATDANVEEVVVTGTSIRGEQPVGSDLISVTRDDIVAIGAPTTAQLLTKVPQLNSFNTLPRPGLNASVGVATSPGLRGLNPTATLILLDGQRLVAENPLQSTPDPSSIPPAAIERVEVIADGASAIYGSDAVAGVINIITRKNLNGAETSIRKGWAQNGYDAIDISQALGRTWSTGSAMVVAAFNENSHLANYDLPFYTEDLRPFGGIDLRPTNCFLPNLSAGGVTYAPPTYAPGAAARCTPGLLNDTLPDYRRTSVIANFRQQVTEDLSVYANVKHTATYVSALNAPAGTNVTITSANPFFLRPPGVTANSASLQYNLGNIIPFVKNSAYSKSNTFIAGANYTLPRNFLLSATANYGVGKNEAASPSFSATALAAAAAGTTTATALDPFGSRTNPAVVAAIADFENLFTSKQKLYDYQVKIDGPLFTLPAGEMKIAVGAGHRKYTYDATNSVGAKGANQGLAVVDADRTVKAVFAEVLVPVVSEANAVPLIRALNLSAAVRHDDYSDFGKTTNPKFGVTWTPVEGLLLRGSYGTSFHAPDMGDSYAVDTRALYFANFPIVPPGSPPLDTLALAGGNPGLLPEDATTYSVGAEFNSSALPGFRASVTYWNIEYTGQIRTAPISQEVFTNPAFQFVVTPNPTRAQIDAIAAMFRLVGTTAPIPTVAQIIDLRRQNLSATKTDGIDWSVSQRWSTDFGNFVAGLSGTETLNFKLQSATGAPFVGQTNVIKSRIRGELSWLDGPMSANAAVNYSGKFSQSYTLTAGGTAVQKVDPFVTVDLQASYEFPDRYWLGGTTFSVNIDNAFDEEPPLVLVGGGYSVNATPLGRTVWVGIQKKW